MKDKIINELKKIKRTGIDNLIEWLEKTDFFTAPASTRFHSNKKGGLAEHSWYVYTLLKEKNQRFNLGLSEQEYLMIRWHQSYGDYEWKKYIDSVQRIAPAVMALVTADIEACAFLE